MGIYAASTAKRVVSQKSPCKNEERRQRRRRGRRRRRRRRRRKRGTIPSEDREIRIHSKPRSACEATLSALLSLAPRLLDAQSDKRRRCARSEKRSAWRIAAAVRSPRRFVNRPIAAVPVRERRRHRRRRRPPAAKMPQKSDVTRFDYPASRSCVPKPRAGGTRVPTRATFYSEIFSSCTKRCTYTPAFL